MARRPETRTGTRPVTLREIARRTGVHVSTVSRALNARTRHLVANDVAARIAATASDLGYRVNFMAAALRTRRTMTAGLIVDDLADPLTAARLAAIEAVLRDAGYALTAIATGGDPARLAAALDLLDGHGADGAILLDRQPAAAGASPTDPADPADAGAVAPGNADTLPLVTPADLPDGGAAAIGRAVVHLVQRGHRAIGHIAGPADSPAGRDRLAGFRAAMTDAGLFATAIGTADGFTIEAGQHAAAALLERRQNLTALVAADDRLALGALDAIAARKLRCPADISVTGLGDLPLSDRTTPPLTTIRLADTAQRAAQLLLAHLDDAAPAAPLPPSPAAAPGAIIVRGSTGPVVRR